MATPRPDSPPDSAPDSLPGVAPDAPPGPAPDFASLLRELKEVRRAGLVRLRGRELPALESAAGAVTAAAAGATAGPVTPTATSTATGTAPPAATSAAARTPGAAVETLLRLAVSRLDAGTLRTAAEYTLGLAQGTRDWPASSRRARAASVYGVSVERFRKDHEVMVLGQIAEHVVRLVAEGVTASPAAPVDGWGTATHGTVDVLVGDRPVRLTVHAHPVDLLRDVDVVVSPSNVYFALPEPYKASVAASLRRAAAEHGVTGEVLRDPLPEELRRWAARNGTAGRAVLPGTVAATTAGALAEQGVRRIYHAAIAVPRAGTNDYNVLPADVTRAVFRALALLAEEHDHHTPPLRSVCFPLLGSGRGGLPYQVSLAAVWAAVEAELARGAEWDIHFVVHDAEAAELVQRLPAGTRPAHDRRPTG